ncbi:hypothetical protein R3X25_03065 [Lutibacter sp. TH_r2]|uniref:hypothetical protein n=1 Tax=Lutibacter sp. TH_r2 TaxID=3082083 RepID=UPI002953A873|nr:hypothetical protein [Lutibacter sp. TH_r2]MDV7186250.1 hypothetical protein [Lutibacter sp. TH_r2]
MKKFTLLLVTVFTVNFAFSQFYVSASGGYAIPSAGVKMGEKITTSETEVTYGSFGEGLNGQLRFGYQIDETFGVELGIGYLHGDDQIKSDVNIPNYRMTDAIARGRAFGVLPQLTYRFNDHFYGRIGALLKVGGKTEAIVDDKNYIADEASGTTISTAFGLPAGAFTHTNYTVDFHGRLPLGVVAALGYKWDIGNNMSFFTELEYMGVSVTRKDSEFVAFNTDVVLADGTVAVEGLYTLDNLPAGYVKETEYVDDLDSATLAANGDDPYPAKKLSETVPYSSFGINFGITYTFSKKEKN